FQAQDRSGPTEADLGDEALKAVASGQGGPRMPLILIDDLDPLLGPSQVARTPGQIILPGSAGGVLADLNRGGLADIDLRQPVEMIRPDLGDERRNRHGETSRGLRWTLRSRSGTRGAPGTE